MPKLFRILTDTLLIWSRNFTLIYVFLLGLLLLQFFIPANEMPALEARWLMLAGVILLLFAAMMSGFYGMVALACQRFLSRPREQAVRETSPVDAITLFQGFLPGISRFLLPVVGGYLIHIGMGALLALPMFSLLTKYAPLLQRMSLLSLDARMTMMTSLPLAEQQDFLSLSSMMLAAMLVFALFSLMAILWPAFVVYYGDNPFRACFRSMTQYFKDPLTLIGMIGVLLIIRTPLFLLNSISAGSGNLLLSLLSWLLDLFAEIFIAIMVFTYVYQSVGKPVTVPEPSEPQKPTSSTDSDENW
jgi:hypothetical protein